MSGRIGRAALVIALFVILWGALSPAHAYLKLGFLTPGGIRPIRWTRTIQYLVTNRDSATVTAPQLQTTVARAFATWAGEPNIVINHAFVGFTGAEPLTADGANVIGFQSRPELERTLAAAQFQVDTTTGEIVESDIFFNTAFAWSVATAGQADRFDLESVGLHEVGHLLGLGHSALGETEIRATGGRRVLGKRAVMFPIAYPPGNIEDRTLEADDRAGIGDVYAFTTSQRTTGTIGGRVTMNGAGIFGAHVTAFNTRTGDIVGGFTLDSQGNFGIAGLVPGVYVLRAEPIDDADTESFFDEDTTVTTSFKPAYLPTLVTVPRGGSGPLVEIRVVAK